MKYGRLTEGRLEQAPNPILDGSVLRGNAPAEIYARLGWLPVTETPFPAEAPESGYFWAQTWTRTDGGILRVWEQQALPQDAELDPDEALDILLGGAT